MKVAIVGSRNFTPMVLVAGFMYLLDRRIEIVSGGAPGVDREAQQCAEAQGMKVAVFPAEWVKYRPANPNKKNPAGMIRNQQIVDYSDVVVAFWDETSPGTRNTIERAKTAGKPVHILNGWQSEDTLRWTAFELNRQYQEEHHV